MNHRPPLTLFPSHLHMQQACMYMCRHRNFLVFIESFVGVIQSTGRIDINFSVLNGHNPPNHDISSIVTYLYCLRVWKDGSLFCNGVSTSIPVCLVIFLLFSWIFYFTFLVQIFSWLHNWDILYEWVYLIIILLFIVHMVCFITDFFL